MSASLFVNCVIKVTNKKKMKTVTKQRQQQRQKVETNFCCCFHSSLCPFFFLSYPCDNLALMRAAKAFAMCLMSYIN